MNVVLDTHVLVWLAVDPKKLTRAATAALRRAHRAGGLSIAGITLWELAVLFATGRLRATTTVESALRDLVEQTCVTVLPTTIEIAALAAQAPAGFPPDPADRIIAATARTARCPLVTADERIKGSGYVRVVW